MAKAKTNYTFMDGTHISPRVKAGYVNVKKPDDEYNTYAIMMNLPKNDKFTKELFRKTLALENSCREQAGIDPAEYPSNWLKDGKPHVSPDGECFVVKAVLNAQRADGSERQPKLYNAKAVEDYTIDVWGGDIVRVEFSCGVWTRGKEAGSKYFLQSVQLIEAGERDSGPTKFEDETGGADEDTTETTETATTDENVGVTNYDEDDVPF